MILIAAIIDTIEFNYKESTAEMRKIMTQLIPQDPIILLSFINTQLRDYFNNLTEFCKAYMVDETYIIQKLQIVDYTYNEHTNQFI